MKRVIFFGLLISFNLSAQDVHFSQFDKSNNIFNPSLIGYQKLDYKIGIQRRSQWSEVSTPFKTTTIFFEIKEIIKNQSAGISFLYDISGDSKLTSTGLSLGTSRTLNFKTKNKLKIGFQASAYQRNVDFSSLIFPQQQVTIIEKPFWFFDLSLGGSYIQEISKKTQIKTGCSAFHINQPKQTFLNSESLLPVRYSIHTELKYKYNKKYIFSPKSYYTFQGESQEIIIGTDVDYVFKLRKNQKINLKTALYTRINDAVIIALGVEANNLVAIFNYDINISPLSKASNLQGAGEITVIYMWNKKDKKIKEKCPKYL